MKKVSKKFRNIRSKKETLVQVFSCEFLEISKNTFFTFGRVLLTVRRSSLHPILFYEKHTFLNFVKWHTWVVLNQRKKNYKNTQNRFGFRLEISMRACFEEVNYKFVFPLICR